MTPQDIADLLQREGSGGQEDDYDETLESGSVVQRRTELLADVLKTCTELLRHADVDQLEVVAEKLGDGSRDTAWRLPYGDSGILSFFLQQLAREDLTNKLKIHSLRIVGNTCADTTKNRARLVEEKGMETIINQLEDETVVQYTIPVLYNVMVEYGKGFINFVTSVIKVVQGPGFTNTNTLSLFLAEPAQSLASELKISQAMMKLLSSPSLPRTPSLPPLPTIPSPCSCLSPSTPRAATT
ncbi:hypothetical protein NQ176_g11034 [Zarea fungicola]|uniref:Uncharacterized protein n=1 Tax=Zarea fungicola TaxID=93591 RepID=A0ACC1MCP8_9HYPO|nr:hypothetical protein NQ176_g11034 [Lecanicillium fungicola]